MRLAEIGKRNTRISNETFHRMNHANCKRMIETSRDLETGASEGRVWGAKGRADPNTELNRSLLYMLRRRICLRFRLGKEGCGG